MTTRKWIVTTDHLLHFQKWTVLELCDNGEQVAPPDATIGSKCLMLDMVERNPEWFYEVKSELFDKLVYNLGLNFQTCSAGLTERQMNAIAYLATNLSERKVI